MNWIKRAKAGVSEKELNEKLKAFIKSSPFFQKLFVKFHVPMSRMDSNLTFEVKNIDGKNAVSDSDTITFNKKLFEQYDFMTDGIHFVAHEISHWLQRQREDNVYLSDPEEIESFSTGIAYELGRGKNEGDIRKIYYPILADHFSSDHDTEIMFKTLVQDAIKRLKELDQKWVGIK